MLTSPQFEIESFDGSSQLGSVFGNDDDNEEDEDNESSMNDHHQWGMVSNSDSGIVTTNTHVIGSDEGDDDAGDYVGPGFLILEGAESNSSRNGSGGGSDETTNTNFSIPGTDSLPTEIDTLSEGGGGVGHPHGDDEIGAIDDDDDDYHRHSEHFVNIPRKRSSSLLVLTLSSMAAAVASTGAVGFFALERNKWRSSTLKLGQEMERLEREHALKLQEETQRWENEKQAIQDSSSLKLLQEMERLEREHALKLQEEIHRLEEEKQQAIRDFSCPPRPKQPTSSPIWDNDDDDDRSPEDKNPNEFTIIDNCWLKAKASVQFGPCSGETKNSLNDFATNTWEDLKAMWNGTSSIGRAALFASMAGAAGTDFLMDDDENDLDPDDVPTAAPISTGYSTKKTSPPPSSSSSSRKRYSSQGRIMLDDDSSSSSSSSSQFDFEEAKASLTQASGAVSEAFFSVSEAMKDLSNDPVAHLAAALQAASHSNTIKDTDRITLDGVYEASKLFASASVAMGKVMAETSDIFSVKVSEMMEDPLSFFEFDIDLD